MRFGLSLVLALAVVVPAAAMAQSIPGLGDIGGNTFTMSPSSDYPAPYSQVTVSLSSDSLPLTNATVIATVGGTQIYAGAATSFPVQVGAAGTVTTVRVTLKSEGATYSQTLSIQPQDVALIAEPISSAPPLYPGEPLVPLQGNVRLVAVANLRNAKSAIANPTTDAYVWTVDGIEMDNASGVGKSSIIVPSPLEYRRSDVSVVVSDSSGSLVGGASFSYMGVEPTVRIYEDDPLLGLRYDHALSGSYTINGTEATLYAAPFSLPISNGAPTVQWFLNGAAAQTGNSVTLRPAGSGTGSASLSVTTSGDNSTTANTSLSVIFGTQQNNFFGL